MKKKISKRALLFIVNGVFFALILLTMFFEWICGTNIAGRGVSAALIYLLKYVVFQFVFTILSLVIYYVSIMSDALNKIKTDKKDENEKKEEKQ